MGFNGIRRRRSQFLCDWESRFNRTFIHQNRPRPEFAIRSSRVEKNPVTGILEPYFSSATRRYRIITGVLTLSVMVTRKKNSTFSNHNIWIEDLHCHHIHRRNHNLSNNHQYSLISKWKFTVKISGFVWSNKYLCLYLENMPWLLLQQVEQWLI